MADDNTPSTSNVRFPDWQLEYEAALLEVDPQKLPDRVKAAETAIFLRHKRWCTVPMGMRSRKPSKTRCVRYGLSRRKNWATPTGTSRPSNPWGINALDIELEGNMLKKRVFLVEDNTDIRKAVRRLFHVHPNFEVVGEAEHGREAVEKAPSLRPDLIVLDLSMPVMNGLDAAPRCSRCCPTCGSFCSRLTMVPKCSGYHVQLEYTRSLPRARLLPT